MTEHPIDTAIAAVTEAATNLTNLLPEGDELVTRSADWSTRTRSVEVGLAAWRRMIETEAFDETGSNPVVGDESVLVPTPKYEWRFNPARILADYGAIERTDLIRALLALEKLRAVKLVWSITKLRDAFHLAGLLVDEKKGSEAWVGLDDMGGPHAGREKVGESVQRLTLEQARQKGITQ